ncbi:MAG: SMC-Scp complex subunit ScpB [Planctomycetales bacterium]
MAREQPSSEVPNVESASEEPSPELDNQEVSLEKLAAAFAEMTAAPIVSPSGEPSSETPSPALPQAETADKEEEDEDPNDVPEDASALVTSEGLVEAMLFMGDAGNKPLTSERAASLIRDMRPEEVDQAVQELNERYDRQQAPYHVVRVDGGWKLALREEFHSIRDKFYGQLREARLSQAAVDVLAVTAYHQPLSADDVSRLRGVPSNHILQQLVRRRLLRVERVATEGRPTNHYFVTDRFLQLFGLDDVDDLPRIHDLE